MHLKLRCKKSCNTCEECTTATIIMHKGINTGYVFLVDEDVDIFDMSDWVLSVCHRSKLDDRKRRLCITGIAGKLRHRLTGIGINILSDGLVVAKITFQDILCICDTFPYLVPS